MKIVGFTAVLLVLVYMGTNFAPGLPLNQSGSELCFSCHEDLQTDFNKQYVHSPVQEGNTETGWQPNGTDLRSWWLKIFDKSRPPDAKLANGGFALAKILNSVYIS